jgi:hypothetical protein
MSYFIRFREIVETWEQMAMTFPSCFYCMNFVQKMDRRGSVTFVRIDYLCLLWNKRLNQSTYSHKYLLVGKRSNVQQYLSLSHCVCVCVCERERSKETFFIDSQLWNRFCVLLFRRLRHGLVLLRVLAIGWTRSWKQYKVCVNRHYSVHLCRKKFAP